MKAFFRECLAGLGRRIAGTLTPRTPTSERPEHDAGSPAQGGRFVRAWRTCEKCGERFSACVDPEGNPEFGDWLCELCARLMYGRRPA